MDDFNLYSAFIEAVEAGNNLLDAETPADAIDDLLPERVLLVFIDHKVGRQSFVQEGVVVLEDYFNLVVGLFRDQLPGNQDFVVQKLNVLGLEDLSIDHQIFYAAASEVDFQVVLPFGHLLKEERDVDDALVGVSLHQTQNDAVPDILEMGVLAEGACPQSVPECIFDQGAG